ncbi:MAG TPA: Uma2 family endonuclease [Thermoanaerobaculia bacterium]|nr:Uma2 family endonuclease [Thermoanaerobaculia bacterium]
MALHDDYIRKLTYDDYVLIPDDGQRHEIIDGEHYVSAAPFIRHQRIARKLVQKLGPPVDEHGLGEVFLAPCDLVFSRHDVVQPDLLFISKERLRIVTEKNVQGAPDLVIEILSESTRRLDEDVKFDLYERSGVLEYWILDPVQRTARIYRLKDGCLRLVAELSAAARDAVRTPLLPGIEVPLVEIFE